MLLEADTAVADEDIVHLLYVEVDMVVVVGVLLLVLLLLFLLVWLLNLLWPLRLSVV